MQKAQDLINELRKHADSDKAKILSRFFKTGKGEYGEGDVFIGVKVPKIRQIAQKYQKMDLTQIKILFDSPIHEVRLMALVILVGQFEKASTEQKANIYKFYITNKNRINNWDLIDISAPKIVGAYLLSNHSKKAILTNLAGSNNLWDRRIAMLVTFAFIKNNQFEDAFKVAEILIYDKHQLIQKAVGWMLREIGKRDQNAEEKFLKTYYKTMPRIALRYAIEKFSLKKKKEYLYGQNPSDRLLTIVKI